MQSALVVLVLLASLDCLPQWASAEWVSQLEVVRLESEPLELLGLEVLLEALGFLARRLRSCDRLSIIAFNHRAKVVTGLRRMDLAGKESVAGAISSSWALRPAGGTDIVAGVQLACSVLGRRRQSNAITSLLLFTDGQDDDAYVLCGGSDQACSRPSPPPFHPLFRGGRGRAQATLPWYERTPQCWSCLARRMQLYAAGGEHRTLWPRGGSGSRGRPEASDDPRPGPAGPAAPGE